MLKFINNIDNKYQINYYYINSKQTFINGGDMVQILKDDIRDSILKNAKQEFLKKGFEKASMRSLASSAGITVGNVYKYYRNKNELFNAVLHPVYTALSEIIMHHDDEVYNQENIPLDQIFNEQIARLLEVVKYGREEFLILINGSEGSPYGNAKNDLISQFGESINDHLDAYCRRLNCEMPEQARFAASLARSYLEGLFSIISSFTDSEQISKYAGEFLKIIFYGFKTIIKGDNK